MFNEEVRRLLVQVVSSWQVWAVTIVLVLYITVVNRVAKIYYKTKRRDPPKSKAKSKAETPKTPAPAETDDFGLEEQSTE